MASVWIVKRSTPAGTRYVVRYRLGGRETRQRHGGTFTSRREAEGRQRWIAGELAALRIPVIAIDTAPAETLAQAGERYLATRIDATGNTLRTYRQAFKHLGAFGERAPREVRAADVQEWVAGLVASGLSPATVRKYLDPVRAVLDFCEIAPNPARSPLLRLPSMAPEEVSPPSHAHVQALLEAITPRHRLHVEVLAETGLRSVELESLTWGDLDFLGCKLRVAHGRTKGRTAGRRWVPLPPALLDEIGALKAPEDRDALTPVFPDVTNRALGNAMARACKLAGIPTYTPHDLRHRFISILVMSGVPITVVQKVAGHGRASVTLDIYSHVILDEPAEYVAEVRARVVFGVLGGAAKVAD